MKLKINTLIILALILLPACTSSDSVSLEGTSWRLVTLGNLQPVEGSTITISFEDGQVSGSSGCNSYGGEYQVIGEKLEIGVLMSTLMACADPAMMDQESSYMKMLENAQNVKVVNNQLQIFGSGSEAMTFSPVKE